MIASKDRSGYFGASDVSYIVGNWKTKSWLNWWLIKMGINKSDFESQEMNAGTHWEHRILESLDIDMEFDKQIIIPDILLRVNLDGNTEDKIYECKTHKADKKFRCPKKYIDQVIVQMYATGLRAAEIVHYALVEEDYKNYFRDIDPERRGEIDVEYNKSWVDDIFLPKITILSDCLRKGIIPEEAL